MALSKQDETALREDIEDRIKGDIDELAALHSFKELWRLWDYLTDRLPLR